MTAARSATLCAASSTARTRLSRRRRPAPLYPESATAVEGFTLSVLAQSRQLPALPPCFPVSRVPASARPPERMDRVLYLLHLRCHLSFRPVSPSCTFSVLAPYQICTSAAPQLCYRGPGRMRLERELAGHFQDGMAETAARISLPPLLLPTPCTLAPAQPGTPVRAEIAVTRSKQTAKPRPARYTDDPTRIVIPSDQREPRDLSSIGISCPSRFRPPRSVLAIPRAKLFAAASASRSPIIPGRQLPRKGA
jgi:hypothetical protein